MQFTQMTIYDESIIEKKEPLQKNKLTTIEHEILNAIKMRPVATEAIMDTYNVSRADVRKMIKRIRLYKPGQTMVMNCRVKYNGKMCFGYSVDGEDYLYARWKSSTETLLANDPFKLESCFKKLNEIKSKIERPAEHQIKAPLTDGSRPHDVTYKDYKRG